MTTLLEKSPPRPLPTEVLRLRHRWRSWRGVLVGLAAGFAATLLALWLIHPSEQMPANWRLLSGIWAGGILLTILGAIIAARFAPSSLLDTAQQMDRALTAKNRLETSAALHGSNSPLAEAQREETAAYLARATRDVKPDRAFRLLLGGVFLLVIAHLLTLGIWTIPALHHAQTPSAPPPPKETPKASIIWKSPEAETEANPIEEVPTAAVAQSTSGLKNLSLEISVNGLFKKSVPLPATPFNQPGKNDLKVSLYMDELQVEPFDIVSYFIRGQRISDQKLPDTTSAIQFVQVRRFRDDVAQMRSDSPGQKHYNLLIRLKLAELRSITENFILAHTDLPVTDPVRMKENTRVGKDQGELSAKTEEVVQAFIQGGDPAEVIDLLQQAEAPMTDASKKILANQNTQALPPQEKALSLIVEVEKYFRKVIEDSKHGVPQDNPSDPFKDKQQHEMKKRMEVAAGKLELLAKNQTALANDLGHAEPSDAGGPSPAGSPSSPNPGSPSPSNSTAPAPEVSPGQSAPPAPGSTNPDGSPKPVPLPPTQAVDPFAPDSGQGTFAERQTRVLQGIKVLLNGNSPLAPEITNDLQAAQKETTDSMKALDQGSNAGARDPAAAGAQDLQKAVADMNKVGEQEAHTAMNQAQQSLNDLARKLDQFAQNGPSAAQQNPAELAPKVEDVRRQLEKRRRSSTGGGLCRRRPAPAKPGPGDPRSKDGAKARQPDQPKRSDQQSQRSGRCPRTGIPRGPGCARFAPRKTKCAGYCQVGQFAGKQPRESRPPGPAGNRNAIQPGRGRSVSNHRPESRARKTRRSGSRKKFRTRIRTTTRRPAGSRPRSDPKPKPGSGSKPR